MAIDKFSTAGRVAASFFACPLVLSPDAGIPPQASPPLKIKRNTAYREARRQERGIQGKRMVMSKISSGVFRLCISGAQPISA